jgi:hypothetical protein
VVSDLRLPSWIVVVLAVGLFAGVALAVPVFVGLESRVRDKPAAPPADLARQALSATQYLVTLATAVLGLIGLLLSEKLTNVRERLDERSRSRVFAGATVTGLSLLTGFMAMWVILRASADKLMRAALDWVLWLNLAQLVELGLGMALIGWSVLKATLWATSAPGGLQR